MCLFTLVYPCLLSPPENVSSSTLCLAFLLNRKTWLNFTLLKACGGEKEGSRVSASFS